MKAAATSSGSIRATYHGARRHRRAQSRHPVGRPVLLTLRAKDVGHAFYVPELRIQQDFVPGLAIRSIFIGTQTGKYEIGVYQLCGLGALQHAGRMSR